MSDNLTEIAAVLDRAADHIDTVGWHRFALYDDEQSVNTPPSRCRVCVLGAINVALHGTPLFALRLAGTGMDTHGVAAYVERRLGSDDEMATWNDMEGRTQDEVTAMLRETAAELRGGAVLEDLRTHLPVDDPDRHALDTEADEAFARLAPEGDAL